MSVAIVPTAQPGKTGKNVAAIHEESDTEAASFGKPREEWCRAIHL